MSADTFTMAAAARAIGLSYDRFRKVWRDLAAREGFPAPFLGRRWDGEAVEAWRRARSHRPIGGRAPRPAPAPVASLALERARRQLENLRSV